MILVTTGTTIPFDPLIITIDRLVRNERISEKVICQIGNGTYIPQHCLSFRFRKSIDRLVDKSSLVISHGGTGTILQLMSIRKPFIAVANPCAKDNHQHEFLEKLWRLGAIVCAAI